MVIPVMEIFNSALLETFTQPISTKESKIEVAGSEASVPDGSFVEFTDAKRNQFYSDASVDGLEEMGLFLQGILKVRIVAKGNAERRHRSSGSLPNHQGNWIKEQSQVYK